MKAFQLRAARSVTGIGVREIALYLGVSGTIVSRWDNMFAFKVIKSKITNPNALIFFFKQHNISFPSDYSISYTPNNIEIEEIKNASYLTRFQLRASRSILKLSQRELAELTNTNSNIINYLETLDNKEFINNTAKDIDTTIYKSYFEEKGFLFPDHFTVVLNYNI